MTDLEETKSQVEGAEPTSTEKGVKPTESKETPTVRTYTQDELDKAVGKGVSSVQSQLSLQKQAAEAAKAEAEKYKTESASRLAQIDSIKREVEEALVDDPEKRATYISRIKNLEREQKLADREAEVENKSYQAEKAVFMSKLAMKSIELKEKYQVPQGVLDTCITEEQMETIAKAFPEIKEPEEKTPKFDSAVSSGGGDWRDLSPDDKIRRGVSKK